MPSKELRALKDSNGNISELRALEESGAYFDQFQGCMPSIVCIE
jgi:hypothetical protein